MEKKSDVKFTLASVVLDAKDAHALSAFYQKLLGWEVAYDDPCFVVLGNPNANVNLVIQTEEYYQSPVWPDEPDKPKKMAHADFYVSDIDQAVSYAESLGAVKAKEQFIPDLVVMLDPSGHPFCLMKQQ